MPKAKTCCFSSQISYVRDLKIPLLFKRPQFKLSHWYAILQALSVPFPHTFIWFIDTCPFRTCVDTPPTQARSTRELVSNLISALLIAASPSTPTDLCCSYYAAHKGELDFHRDIHNPSLWWRHLAHVTYLLSPRTRKTAVHKGVHVFCTLCVHSCFLFLSNSDTEVTALEYFVSSAVLPVMSSWLSSSSSYLLAEKHLGKSTSYVIMIIFIIILLVSWETFW